MSSIGISLKLTKVCKKKNQNVSNNLEDDEAIDIEDKEADDAVTEIAIMPIHIPKMFGCQEIWTTYIFVALLNSKYSETIK